MDGTSGACEAKTKFAELLDRAERGESLTTTRKGQPVARLVPMAPPETMSGAEAEALVERFRGLREELRAAGAKPFTPEEIVELVHAGRKY